MTTYENKRAAKARIANHLLDRPDVWTVYGYTPDASDGMTDYYSPAHWDGVAVHQASGVVLCVDVSDYVVQSRSGGTDRYSYVRDDECQPCAECNGTGRAGPQAHGNDALRMRYGLSPGECIPCGATGKRARQVVTREAWPTFTAVARGRSWHLELNGSVLAGGRGLCTAEAAAFVAAVEAAIEKHTRPPRPSKRQRPPAAPATAAHDTAPAVASRAATDAAAVPLTAAPADVVEGLRYRFRYRTVDVEIAHDGPKTPCGDQVAAIEIARAHYAGLNPDQEHFSVIALDARHRVNWIETVSTGSLTASLVHPREVFRTAVGTGAATIIVVHNHPSGDVRPSDEDEDLTRLLVLAGDIIGIPIADHLILSANGAVGHVICDVRDRRTGAWKL